MFRKISMFIIFTALFSVTVCPVTVFAYKGSVHKGIATKALDKSNTGPFLGHIGFENGIEHEIKGNFDKPKTVAKWVEYGSEWEDWVLVYHYVINSPEGIIYGHFYNPLTNNGLTDKQGNILGQSLIERATDTSNEWSYQMAKELFYAALTGNNTGINFWRMRDHKWTVGIIKRKTDMNEKEREEFFAWTFQSLGHTLHLLADASVPAHTRNDGHSGKFIPFLIWDPEPYESWTEDNFGELKYYGDGSAPWTAWQDHSEIQVPDVFIDTDRLLPDTSEPFTDLDQGLAEYSHANFLSKDTVFDSGLPSTLSGLHEVARPPYENLGNSVFVEEKEMGDFVGNFAYVASKHADGPKHFALCGILWHIKDSTLFPNCSPAFPGYSPLTEILYTVDDDSVNKDYAEKLIPRAVGYSAGLLDYFFRGRIEIAVSDTGLYSFIPDPEAVTDPRTQGFKKITFLARNVSKKVTDGEETPEEMTGGKLTLVIKYRLSETDPFQAPFSPTPGEFRYIVKELGDNCTLSSSSFKEFEADLSTGPLPLWATDVCLYLVYRGKLGSEDSGIAAGFEDICEPTPMYLFNATDRICIYDQIFDAGSEKAEDAVKAYRYADIYPHKVTNIFVRFSSAENPLFASSSKYDYKVPAIAPGYYDRHFILPDADHEFAVSVRAGAGVADGWKEKDIYGHSGIVFIDYWTWSLGTKHQGTELPVFEKFRKLDLLGSFICFTTPYPEAYVQESLCPFEDYAKAPEETP